MAKKASPAQLAARAKFAKMVKDKKASTKPNTTAKTKASKTKGK